TVPLKAVANPDRGLLEHFIVDTQDRKASGVRGQEKGLRQGKNAGLNNAGGTIPAVSLRGLRQFTNIKLRGIDRAKPRKLLARAKLRDPGRGRIMTEAQGPTLNLGDCEIDGESDGPIAYSG